MEFDAIYCKAIKLWPSIIDISDGRILERGSLFDNLNFKWELAEKSVKRKKMNEWIGLMTWIIFKNLKHVAIYNLKNGQKVISKNQIDMEKVKADFLENLKCDGYEEMLEEFKKDNEWVN